ncbi:cytochrome C oxidase subunit III [Mycolicibacterium mucogenicum]|uniref:Probable cytochrome c oxidase subunit 3 n=1 Tax=Mycolicibacterium mucogenicum TaxID=56689 RepID=A0A1A3H4F4_MYCMU|nr:cytochrome C oxidase subunit III [Mycolicibacterium mucogenicum]
MERLGTQSLSDAPPDHADVRRHIPGEPGIWILIFGDMLLFTVLFGAYLRQRGENREMFAMSQDALSRNLGALNTVILLTSSVVVVFATKAMRSTHLRAYASRLTFLGMAIGFLFIIVKTVEYHEKISAGITPSVNGFYMYYFVLTGLHLLHVVIGLAVLATLSVLARDPAPSDRRISFFEGGACFWHMVDLLWIVIFPLVFLVR